MTSPAGPLAGEDEATSGPFVAVDGPPRVGVVGVGSLGYHHARILSTLDGVEMAGIHETRRGRADDVGGELGVAVHRELDALLDEVDALVVAVPTIHHEAVAVAALERGIHVLVEKPMAPDLAAADRILDAAGGSGALVQIGHVERFNPAVLAAESYLDRPLFVESHRLAPFSPRSTDVAVVLDLMIHDVDLVQSLVGTPIREIAASGVPVLTPSVDIANARLTFEGGAVANLTASRISVEKMRKLRIFQRSGYLSLNLADGTGEYLRLKADLPALREILGNAGGSDGLAGPAGDGGSADALERALAGGEVGLADIVERVPLVGEPVEPLRKELENFRDAVRGRTTPAVSGKDGRAALAVTLGIEERIHSHVADSRTP